MSTNTSFVNVGEVIEDAAIELRDPDFNRGGGRPVYVAAAYRGIRKMCMDTFSDRKEWSAAIPEDLSVELPKGLIGMEGVWLFNGDTCNVNRSTVLFIKRGMHRTGGTGYFANNKWNNRDPLQASFGWYDGLGSWNCEPPSCLHFAGEWNGRLDLSVSCRAYQNIHVAYYGTGADDCSDDFMIPEWAADAIQDFVIHRMASIMEREDPQHLGRVIQRKENELKAANGSWTQAKFYWKGMDRKKRYDTMAMTFRIGPAS